MRYLMPLRCLLSRQAQSTVCGLYMLRQHFPQLDMDSGNLAPLTASAVTLGFIAFAFGNWKLLKQALRINRTLRADLIAASSGSVTGFESTIRCLAETANPFW